MSSPAAPPSKADGRMESSHHILEIGMTHPITNRKSQARLSWCSPRIDLLCLTALALTSQLRADAISDYNVALAFYKQQRWDRAEEQFEKFLSNYSQDERAAAAQLYLGQARVHQRKFSKAREVFRQFAAQHKQHPDRYLAVYRIGECSYFLGDLKSAQKELKQFLDEYQKHELAKWAWQYLGESYLRSGDAKQAVETFQHLLDNYPDGTQAHEARFLQARAFLKLGDQAKALNNLQQVAKNPASHRADDAQLEIAMIYYDAQDYPQALKAFDEVSTRFSDSELAPMAALNGGYAAYHLGNFSEAAKRFQQAAKSPRYKSDATFWLGMSYKSAKNYEQAIGVFKQLASSDAPAKTKWNARFQWGDCHLRRQEYAEANKQFLAVVDGDSKGPLASDALHLACESALLAGDLAQAEALHERFRQQYSGSGLWLLQRVLFGRVLTAQGDRLIAKNPEQAQQRYTAAVTEFSEVLSRSQVDRTSKLARLELARAQQRRKRPADVMSALRPMLKSDANEAADEFAEAFLMASRAELELKNYAAAAQWAELFLNKTTDQPDQTAEALANMAYANERGGQHDAADQTLDRLWKKPKLLATAQRVTYELAEEAYGKKAYPRAATLYQRLLSADAGEYALAAMTGLAYALYEGKDYPQAAKAFLKLEQQAGQDRKLAADALYMAALATRRAGDQKAAKDLYAKGMKAYSLTSGEKPPDDPAALQLGYKAYQCAKGLARLHRESGEIAQADKAYQAAYEELQLQPESRKADLDKLLNEWALLHYEQEDYARSEELFKRLVQEHPQSDLADDASLYLSEGLYFRNNFNAAKQAFLDLANQKQADDFVRHRSLVLLLDIYAAQEDWAALAPLAERLAREFPNSAELNYAAYRRGEALLKSGSADQAVAVLEPLYKSQDASIRNAEWFPSVRLLLAEAKLQQRDYPEVEAIVAQFRKEDSESPYLYFADEILGRRFKNQARFKEAREAFTRVVESKAGHRTETAAKAQLMIAETFLLEEKYEQAQTEYYKVYANYKFPEYQAPALFQAAMCDEKLKRWSGAAKTYESLIKEFPTSEYAKKAEPFLEQAKRRSTDSQETPPKKETSPSSEKDPDL